MRKLFSIVFILSVAGALLSGYLMVEHYADGALPSWLPCGDPSSSCATLAMSRYSEIAGIPVASAGLFFYLWIAGLAAALALSGYLSSVLVLGFVAVAVAGLGADAVLGGVLVYTKNFCPLCVATYGINLLLVIASFVVFQRERRRDSMMMEKAFESVANLFRDRRHLFGLGLTASYTAFVCISVSAGTFAAKNFFERNGFEADLVRSYVASFGDVKGAPVAFPPSKLSSGKAGTAVTVSVFSDPFCSSCREFYLGESAILKEFADAVRFDHYLLPLEKPCNGAVTGEGHAHSCAASANIIASAQLGFYDEFIRAHWDSMTEIQSVYGKTDRPGNVLAELLSSRFDRDAFEKKALSAETSAYLARDVALAHSIGVRGTPAVFVNGKRLPNPVTEAKLRGVILFMLRARKD